jgi:hypothetical protein
MKAIRKILLAAFVVVALAPVPSANAAFGLKGADVFFSESDGSAAAVAGSHPFELSTTFNLNTAIKASTESPDGALRDLKVEMPIGLAGIPKAVPQCSGADFATYRNVRVSSGEEFEGLPECSDDSAIGYVSIHGGFNPVPVGVVEGGAVALFNLVPGPGTVAKFGFVFNKVPVTIDVRLSEEAPYRVIASIENAPQPVFVFGSKVTVWGDPAAPVHDPYRGSCLAGEEPDGSLKSFGSCPMSTGIANEAFLTLPRACQGPLTSFFTADSWQEPGLETQLSSQTHDIAGAPLGFSGCEELGFSPAIGVAASSGESESPTGLNFGVEFNGNSGISDPTQRADSDLRKIVAKLPEGVTINPSAGEGLMGCTKAQYEAEKLTTAPGAACPQAAKIGTVTATSPLVDEALEGAIFTAAPYDNPFGSFLGIYLVLRNQNLGVIVKQAGKVEADSRTGQLTATFEEAPKLPISKIETQFRDGPRAPLATPRQCGNYTAEALQTSWSGKEVLTTAEFKVDSGPGGGSCPGANGPVSPSFKAGTAATGAGTYSPFNLQLTRNDGEANLTHISVALPEGLTGKLAGIGLCPDSAIGTIEAKSGKEELASPTCPSSSKVGTVTAGAGIGPSLTYVTGSAYLAGPYLGGPYSILVVTPAVAGPFDLGNVIVRQPLRVDPFTAQVTVDGSASPLPRILKGIPLQLRDLRVNIDRSDFTLNATSCEPKEIKATATGAGPSLTSTDESSATLGVHYQAANCSALKFKPTLKITLKGSTKHTGHPALKAVVTYPQGGAYANIARAQVNLPHSEFIDQANLNKTCTKPVLLAGNCPASTIYGKVKAWTPLLDKPLQGNVYLVGGFGFKLPALVAELNGQIRVLLAGKVDSGPNKGIRNTFEAVPDAPVEKFVLEMKGGPKYSLLENSEPLCKKPQRAIARFTAQNGTVLQTKPLIANDCKKKGKKNAKGAGSKKGKKAKK